MRTQPFVFFTPPNSSYQLQTGLQNEAPRDQVHSQSQSHILDVSTTTVCDQTADETTFFSKNIVDVIKKYLLTRQDDEQRAFPLLCIDRKRQFFIQKSDIKHITATFVLVMHLTDLCVREKLKEIKNDKSSKEELISHLKLFQTRQSVVLKDMIPLIEHYHLLLAKAVVGTEWDAQEAPYLFTLLNRCFKAQMQLYRHQPHLRKSKTADGMVHEELFLELYISTVIARNKFQIIHPEFCFPQIELDDSSDCTPFLDFRYFTLKWGALSISPKKSTEDLFNHLLTIMGKYSRFEDLPLKVKADFFLLEYIDINQLRSLSMFRPFDTCLSLLKKCNNIRVIKFGPACEREFLNKFFIAVLKNLAVGKLELLDLSGLPITDEDVKKMPPLFISSMNISGTDINGDGFQAPLSKTLSRLKVSSLQTQKKGFLQHCQRAGLNIELTSK